MENSPKVFSDGTTVPQANELKQTVIYKKVGSIDIQMSIYRPTLSTTSTRSPVLILFPGGGWRSANISGFAGYGDEASFFMEQGWTIAVAQYRLRSDNGNEKFRELASDCGLQGMISDCMDAVRYLVKYKDILNIDTTKICTGGHSAGGHLALMTAFGNPYEFVLDSKLAHYPFKIVVASAKSGPTDLKSDPKMITYISRIFPQTRTDEDLMKCSPISYISSNMCPTIIGYGENDELLTAADHWHAFEAKCKKLGIENCEMIGEDSGHSTTHNVNISNAIKNFLPKYISD